MSSRIREVEQLTYSFAYLYILLNKLIFLILSFKNCCLSENMYLNLFIKNLPRSRSLLLFYFKNYLFSMLNYNPLVGSKRVFDCCIKEIVSVLERVDSPGAPWRQKLDKIQAEERTKLDLLQL